MKDLTEPILRTRRAKHGFTGPNNDPPQQKPTGPSLTLLVTKAENGQAGGDVKSLVWVQCRPFAVFHAPGPPNPRRSPHGPAAEVD
jgi:hypothetical protein